MEVDVSDEVRPTLQRLTRRPQFLAVARGLSAARGAVVIQGLARAPPAGSAVIGVGFTATKKVGDAVTRNRAKRRLREAARALLPLYGTAGMDYVFVARTGAPDRPWPRLLDDVKSALISLATGGDPPRPPATRLIDARARTGGSRGRRRPPAPAR